MIFFIPLIKILLNHSIPDHESDGFQSPFNIILPVNSTHLDSAVEFALSGYARWDGQYFLHIATLGYTHENCLVFFPLYPFLMRFPALLIFYLSFHSLSWWNSCLISSLLINITSSFIAAKFLYLITLRLFGSQKFAYLTWQLFCFSPATIFFIAPYSESLFCALTFVGIYYCINYQFLLASIFFGLSGSTRSNGLINIGFLVYFSMKAIIFRKQNLSNVIGVTVLSVTFATLPFLCYQYYAFRLFCHHQPLYPQDTPSIIQDYLLNKNFTLPGEQIPKWCEHIIPFSYSAIQSQYWNVGFLQYFQWKQLPNFLLATPVLILVLLYAYTYVKENLLSLVWSRNDYVRDKHHVLFRPEADCAFAAHSAFLALFSFFFAHVQVNKS